MAKRGVIVNDPNSVVLVDNVSSGAIAIPREHNKDIIFQAGETAQITWAEFVRLKNIPNFGRLIKLNDSVIISDGKVKIKNMVGSLSNEEMIDLLPQNVDVLKEFAMTLNKAEQFIFVKFLEERSNLGIEAEKCTETIAFIHKEFPETVPDESKGQEAVKAAPKQAKPKQKRKKKNVIGDKELVENDDHLAINVKDVGGDSE